MWVGRFVIEIKIFHTKEFDLFLQWPSTLQMPTNLYICRYSTKIN